MKEIKVYISAPITGRDLEERKSYFDKAAQELKDMGFVPVNPMKNGVREAAAHATHMRADLKMLLASSYYVQALDCVYSAGCCIEEKTAEACDIRYIGAVRSDGSVGLNSYGKKVLRELKYRIKLYEQQNKEAQK